MLEVMVVVLIISILMLVAIPTMTAMQQRARDRAAQTRLGTAHKVELVRYTDEAIFTETLADLTAIDSSVTYAHLPIAAGPTVHVELDGGSAGQRILLGTMAGPNRCLWIEVVGQPPSTQYGSSDCAAEPTSWSPSWTGV